MKKKNSKRVPKSTYLLIHVSWDDCLGWPLHEGNLFGGGLQVSRRKQVCLRVVLVGLENVERRSLEFFLLHSSISIWLASQFVDDRLIKVVHSHFSSLWTQAQDRPVVWHISLDAETCDNESWSELLLLMLEYIYKIYLLTVLLHLVDFYLSVDQSQN